MKRHISDFKRFGLNEESMSGPWSRENMDGVEFLEDALRELSPCELGALIINAGDTQHDYVIDLFVDGLGGMGMFDDVRSTKEARKILLGLTKP